MTAIALWLLLGAPTPSPMPTTAPSRAEALEGAEERPRPSPFLRTGVRVVAGAPASGESPPPKRPALP
jgi:hypothetical protein